jgi:hypothetical protein
MGKTYRNADVISRSISITEDKHRGFARKNDRMSHHSVRNANRNADEMTIERVIKRDRVYKSTPQNPSNIPNISHACGDHNYYKSDDYYFNDDYRQNYDHTLSNEENLKKQLDKVKSYNPKCTDARYFSNTLKQLERRNHISRFEGYNDARDFKMNYDE